MVVHFKISVFYFEYKFFFIIIPYVFLDEINIEYQFYF